MTKRATDYLPDKFTLRPHALTLWLNYLLGIPLLTLICVLSITSVFSDHLSGKPFFVVASVALFIWLVVRVSKVMRTPSTFRFDIPGRTFSITYPFGRRESLMAGDILLYRQAEGSASRPNYDGAKDRMIQLRSNRQFLFPDLHMTRVKPLDFDRLMKEWNVPLQQEPAAEGTYAASHFATNAAGVGVYLYGPRWAWVLLCLALSAGGLVAGLHFLFELAEPGGEVWRDVVLACLMAGGSYAFAMPLIRYPIRAALGSSDIELVYLLRSRKVLSWSTLAGYALGKVTVGGRGGHTPAVILYPKQAAAIVLASAMIQDIEHAPFANFGLPELKAPRPFHFGTRVPVSKDQ